ncbi:EamA family transporter [Desulfovibrio sp. OttesenSCG-928-C06]|nr:EamA family transporter [Desulfovibrio sp. OttesenSCG-928-C06]
MRNWSGNGACRNPGVFTGYSFISRQSRGSASTPVKLLAFRKRGSLSASPVPAVGRVPAAPSLPSAIAILYLAFISMTAMAIWFVLIRMRGAATASSYHLLNPLLGVLLSWLILGTDLRPQDFGGAALIGLGLFVSNCGEKLLARLWSNKNNASVS